MGMKYTGYSLWRKKTHNRRFNTWYSKQCGKVKTTRVDKETLTRILNSDTITDNDTGKEQKPCKKPCLNRQCEKLKTKYRVANWEANDYK